MISSQYTHMPFMFNPAFAASSDVGELHLSGQNLASALDSLVYSSYGVGIHSSLDGFKGGVGGKVLYVYFPGRRYVTISADFSYPVWEDPERDMKLMVGANVGTGLAEATVNTGLLRENRIRFWPDLGAGVLFKAGESFVGVGSRHLANPTVEFTSATFDVIDDIYYLTAGYGFEIEGIQVLSSFLGRWRNSSSFLTDFMLEGEFNEKFGIGAGYRIDLRRSFVPNPSNPVTAERFKQALLSVSIGINGTYFLVANLNYTVNQFVLERSNLELTFTYRFRQEENTTAEVFN